MTYLNTRHIAAIAMCAAYWAILNNSLSPIIFRLTGMPFLCDLLAFTTLILVGWWTRKFGIISLTGLLVTGITFMIQPNATQMIGFAFASILFDIITKLLGYKNSFDKSVFSILILLSFSTICALIAGLIIGSLFMTFNTIWYILGWGGLHAIGGFIGGVMGVILINALRTRITVPS
jgi:hypothetical protein